jgi:hypothetical protein
MRRLADLAFACWESCPEFPVMMEDMLHAQEIEDEEAGKQDFPTVIHPVSFISEAPLPVIFHFRLNCARQRCFH